MKIKVLIPDASSLWALSIIQCLADIQDISIYVLSSEKRTPAKFSRFISYYRYYERTDDSTWIKEINHEIETQGISVILPVAEKEIAFFINNANCISKKAKIMLLPSKETFEIAIDKRKFSEFCNQNSLPHPRSSFILNHEQFCIQDFNLQFPILLKPSLGKGGEGILRFDQKSILETFLEHQTYTDGYFLQEYIDGYDIDCSVLCSNGEVLLHTIQKGFLPTQSVYAPQLGQEFLDNDEVLKITKQLMKVLKWSGIAHVDLRYDIKKNNYKILEVNPRFWGSLEASKAVGINFPFHACALALGKDVQQIPYKHIKYFRLKGVFKYLKDHPRLIFDFDFMKHNTEIMSILKDPLSTLYKFRQWLGRRVKVRYNLLKPFS